MAAQRREQLGERRVGNLAWSLPGYPWPVPARPLVRDGVHRTAMRCGPAGPAGQRERVHDPGARLQVDVVERAEHALAVRHRRGRIPPSWCLLPGHRVRAPRRHDTGPGRLAGPPVRPGRLGRRHHPADEIACLPRGRLIPRDLHRPAETQPAQHVQRIRALRRHRPARRLHLGQEHVNRADRSTVSVQQPERPEHIPGRSHRPGQRYHQNSQIPAAITIDHAQDARSSDQDAADEPLPTPG